jgi:hypothetical protein
MKTFSAATIAIGLLATGAPAQEVAPAPNGIALPENYRDWRIVSVSERTDNETLRVIIGNDVAIAAMRDGSTNPWPDGAILGKIAWNQGQHEAWPEAIVPVTFRQAEFMVKDAAKFADSGGWGFARWVGPEQKPFGEDADFAKECFACHQPVASTDYVFTRPVLMP